VWLHRGVPERLKEILDLFALEDLGDATFVGPQPDDDVERVRVYGGQVAGQAIAAAGRTVAQRRLHSLHLAFLRPGDPSRPLRYGVTVLREGRTFSTRRVTATQGEVVLMEALVSFIVDLDGHEHQVRMPDVPRPDQLPLVEDQLRSHLAESGGDEQYLSLTRFQIVDMRYVDPPPRIAIDTPAGDPSVCRLWLRLREDPPAELLLDPLLGGCLLAYISDWTILDPVQASIGRTWQELETMASVDHAMWFHRSVDFSDWLLYDQRSATAGGGLGLSNGAIFNADGTLVCTVTQEGFVGRRT
jgi:acyl-CoA thioesterase II